MAPGSEAGVTVSDLNRNAVLSERIAPPETARAPGKCTKSGYFLFFGLHSPYLFSIYPKSITLGKRAKR